MAPLPEYRGCNQFSFAIYNGEKEFGTTIHKIDTGVDTGRILTERRFAILDDWCADELIDYTINESKKLFVESIDDVINGRINGIDQSKKLIKIS